MASVNPFIHFLHSVEYQWGQKSIPTYTRHNTRVSSYTTTHTNGNLKPAVSHPPEQLVFGGERERGGGPYKHGVNMQSLHTAGAGRWWNQPSIWKCDQGSLFDVQVTNHRTGVLVMVSRGCADGGDQLSTGCPESVSLTMTQIPYQLQGCFKLGTDFNFIET